jgi:hypothetical protein
VHARLAALAVLALGPAAWLGCGPSFQVVYEGDVHFEHCYALDQGTTTPPDDRKACWRDWLRGYTTGQSRDRVEYAATRLSQLSLDPTLPSEESPSQRPRKRLAAAPMPTSLFAPPPNLAEGANKPAASASVSAVAASARPPEEVVGARAPGAECAETCSRTWGACHKECKDKACEACDKTYRACVPACFGSESPRQPAPPPARSTR